MLSSLWNAQQITISGCNMSGKCPLHWFSACVYLHNQHKALVHHCSGNSLLHCVLILLCCTSAFFLFFLVWICILLIVLNILIQKIRENLVTWIYDDKTIYLITEWSHHFDTCALKKLALKGWWLWQRKVLLYRGNCVGAIAYVTLEWHFTIWDSC